MSANDRQLSASEERVRAASTWLVQLQGDSVSEADVIAWANWCAADPDNLRAFDDLCRFYSELQALKTTQRESFLSLAQINPEPRARAPIGYIAARAATRRLGLAAAGMMAGALLLGFACWWQLRSTGTETQDYQVSRGIQKTLVLADQSQITLGSASEVRSYFTADSRDLELRTGEAYFEVKHDHTRPFVVRAGPLTVRAVGTKFNVRRTTDCTVVVVTDGAIDVTTEEGPGSQLPDASSSTNAAITSVRIHAGQQALRMSSQRGVNVSNVNSAAATAWRAGRLEYIMEPLGSVIDDVNRYTSRRIVIGDTRLRDLIFTGTVFRDHVDDWAATLASSFPLRAQLDADGTVRLEPRAETQPDDFDGRR
jgi:transmembrane sensor